MNYCLCVRPKQNPRSTGYCRRCGIRLDPRWISSDETMGQFYKPVMDLPGVRPGTIVQAQARERDGRDLFGLNYLSRSNEEEALEEFSDALNYAAFSWLVDRRAGIEEIDPDLLDAAHHTALAHAAIERRMRRLRR